MGLFDPDYYTNASIFITPLEAPTTSPIQDAILLAAGGMGNISDNILAAIRESTIARTKSYYNEGKYRFYKGLPEDLTYSPGFPLGYQKVSNVNDTIKYCLNQMFNGNASASYVLDRGIHDGILVNTVVDLTLSQYVAYMAQYPDPVSDDNPFTTPTGAVGIEWDVSLGQFGFANWVDTNGDVVKSVHFPFFREGETTLLLRGASLEIHPSGNTGGTPVWSVSSFDLPITIGYATTQNKLIDYTPAEGWIPVRDFYPIVPLRKAGTMSSGAATVLQGREFVNVKQNGDYVYPEAWEGTKRILKKMGIDPEDIISEIAKNENIDIITDCLFFLGAPILSEKPLIKRYVFEHFWQMSCSDGVWDYANDTIYGKTLDLPAPAMPRQYVYINENQERDPNNPEFDSDLSIAVGCTRIHKSSWTGAVTGSSSINLNVTADSYVRGQDTAGEDVVEDKSVLEFTHDDGEGNYRRVTIWNPQVAVEVFEADDLTVDGTPTPLWSFKNYTNASERVSQSDVDDVRSEYNLEIATYLQGLSYLRRYTKTKTDTYYQNVTHQTGGQIGWSGQKRTITTTQYYKGSSLLSTDVVDSGWSNASGVVLNGEPPTGSSTVYGTYVTSAATYSWSDANSTDLAWKAAKEAEREAAADDVIETIGELKNFGFILPVSKSVLESIPLTFKEKNALYQEIKQLMVQSTSVTEIPWYAQEWFAISLKIIGWVVAIVTFVVSLGSASSISAAIVAIVQNIITSVLVYAIIQIGIALLPTEWIVALTILAVIATVLGYGANSLGNLSMATVNQILEATKVLGKMLNAKIQKELQEYMEESANLSREAAEYYRKHEDRMEALEDGRNSTSLDEAILHRDNGIVYESPTTFFTRTTGIGNPGVLTLEGPRQFVANALRLPDERLY